MTAMHYTIGIDFGTNSVRAIVARVRDGHSVGTGVFDYPSGTAGVLLDPDDPHCARQAPGDYHQGLEACVRLAIKDASLSEAAFDPRRVIGIGVDTTGSSPIPVDRENQPIAFRKEWENNLNAQCWLWKDHTSATEAAEITRLAREHRPQFLARCGDVYSSEWFWSKIWHCQKTAPDAFAAAWSWVELSDYIPSLLCGIDDPAAIRRGVCAAGHKALFAEEWGGLPDKAFLGLLSPELADLRDRLYDVAYDVRTPAGFLCKHWADALGIPEGIPVAMGAMDVHYGAIGAGISEGVLVKAMGTSSCDCCVMPNSGAPLEIPGICGVVNGSILPGHWGLEAGQSAVGDIFKWWVEVIAEGSGEMYQQLHDEASKQKPGEHGLLVLDWHNGNRTVLVDPFLTGMIVGLTLHSSRADIYRALIEGTAFGARVIMERMTEQGVPIERIICCGGLATKNPMLMQIYADVLGCPMQVSRSDQSCALGAAVIAAVLAGAEKGGFDTISQAQQAMTGVGETIYRPQEQAVAIYNELFVLYRQLHDSFGGVDHQANLAGIMKALLALRKKARSGTGE